MTDLQVYATPDELAAAVADFFVDSAQSALTERGAFYVALAGGSTPKIAYALLAQEPRVNAVSWKDVFVYFGDERCVPPDDEQSNYKMAKDAFLDSVPIPLRNVHRMQGEIEPEAAASAYAKVLREDLGDPPRFDLVMLGMGPDGHTASLFPGSHPRSDGSATVAAPFVEKFRTYRITLTPHAINNARAVLIATAGAEKADALSDVLEGHYDPNIRPVQIVRPTSGTLQWMVDRAAASGLRTS